MGNKTENTINVSIDKTSLGEVDDNQIVVYMDLLYEKLQDVYPDHDVSVECSFVGGRKVETDGILDDDTAEEIRQIEEELFTAGEWL